MPAGSRVRANNVYGTTQDNPLLVGAVSFTSLGLNLLPAISGQHAVVVLDPKRLFGEPEIVVVTSHLAMGTTATITRGTYGTTAREHPQGTPWAHVPVGPDDYIPIVTSGTRPADPFRGEMIFETDTNSFVARTTADTWQTVVPIGQWTDYTPTLTQSIAVTKTINYARYIRIGRLIVAQVYLTITSAGTGGNPVVVGLPFAASNTTVATASTIGSFSYQDTGTASYSGTANFTSSTTVAGQAHNQGAFIGQAPSFTTANTDIVSIMVSYEAAA